MRNKNFKIIADLHNFFEDHRKKAFFFVNDKINKISDLQKHIGKILNINDFYLVKEDCYLPEEETINLLEPNDVVLVMPVKNESENIKKNKKKKMQCNDLDTIEIHDNPVEFEVIEAPTKEKKKKSSSTKHEEINPEIIVSYSSAKENNSAKNCSNKQITNNSEINSLAKNVLHKNYQKPIKIVPNTEEYLKNRKVNIIRIDVIKSDVKANDSHSPESNKSIKSPIIESQVENVSFYKQKSESNSVNFQIEEKMELDASPNTKVHIQKDQETSARPSFAQLFSKNSDFDNNSPIEQIAAKNDSFADLFVDPNKEGKNDYLNSTEIDKSNNTGNSLSVNYPNSSNQSNFESNNCSKKFPNNPIYKLRKINGGIGSFLNVLRQNDSQHGNDTVNKKTIDTGASEKNLINGDTLDKNVNLNNDDANQTNANDSTDTCSNSNSVTNTEKRRRKRTRKHQKKNKSMDLGIKEVINDCKPSRVINCETKPAIHIKFDDNNDEVEENLKTEDKIENGSKSVDILKENQVASIDLLKLGDVITFQILKLSENYNPEYSDIITGEIKEIEAASEMIRLHILSGLDELNSPNGKFQLEKEQIQISGNLHEFQFSELLNIKLTKAFCE